jgi:hypothetical protein
MMVILLILIAAGCAATLTISAREGAALAAGNPHRKIFVRIAVFSTASLGLTMVLLVWAAMRYASNRLAVRGPHVPTEYVNAWAVAGQRLQLDDEDEEDEEEGDVDGRPG